MKGEMISYTHGALESLDEVDVVIKTDSVK